MMGISLKVDGVTPDQNSNMRCCSGKNAKQPTQSLATGSGDCAATDCFSHTIQRSARETPELKADSNAHGPERTGCRQIASDQIISKKQLEISACSRAACCHDAGPALSHFSTANSPALDTDGDTNDTPAMSPTSSNYIDIENGKPQPEHVILRVQGMTCSGCEGKIRKYLKSVPQICNVKTSLVLAQAEFDINGSIAVDVANLIKNIERKTGFSCTATSISTEASGEMLDLVVEGCPSDLAHKGGILSGVTDMNVLDKNTIRVTYNPQILGARTLLSGFPMARLAPLAAPPVISEGRLHVRSTFLKTLLSASLTIPVLILAWAPLPKHELMYQTVSLVLATIVQAATAGPFYPRAFNALVFLGMLELDLLIVLSTTTAYAYSVVAYAYLVAGRPLQMDSFFETSTLLVTVIMVGRFISAIARQKAVESISIESLQTPTALLVDQDSGQAHEIDARLLQHGDTFKVLPDTAFVTDGMVMSGQSDVDESFITGESTLVTKRPGSSVIAGSVNHSGTLIVRLTRLPGENTIKTIGTMVDKAKLGKPRIQEIADRFAGYFVPMILVIAILVFAIWAVVGKAVRKQSATTACINAMTYAISALVVSCPCAVGLAVPMVVLIAGGVGARNGIILKSAATIENARNACHIVFDKTGTLTQGKLSIKVEKYLIEDADSLKSIILGLTMNSKHPVSYAMAAHLKASNVHPALIENVVARPGSGIEALFKGSIIRAGNPDWIGVSQSPHVEKILSLDLTMFCVSIDGRLVALFGLNDMLRPDAVETINQLKKRSIDISIVSGDSREAVHSVARQLSISENNVRSRYTPSDKQAYVRELLACKKSVVLFCGDGTNDAAALAQASIGLHMNAGTDIAQSAADAVLMRPSLSGILILMDLSKAFHRRVVFNFLWAFIYNIFAILLAAGAFPRARVSPQFAGLGEIVSVLPVIAVAMQLRWAKFERRQ